MHVRPAWLRQNYASSRDCRRLASELYKGPFMSAYIDIFNIFWKFLFFLCKKLLHFLRLLDISTWDSIWNVWRKRSQSTLPLFSAVKYAANVFIVLLQLYWFLFLLFCSVTHSVPSGFGFRSMPAVHRWNRRDYVHHFLKFNSITFFYECTKKSLLSSLV